MCRASTFIIHYAVVLAFAAILLPAEATAIFPGDTNLDGDVSIAEVQTVINAFLGLIPNVQPLADAGAAQNVEVGTVVTLDGSKSSDPDGYPITYSWSLLTKPAGSSATLTDSSAAKAAFTPDAAGDYTITLMVNDGKLNSAVASVMVTAAPHSMGYTAALTDVATSITNNSANLSGSFTNPNGFTTTIWFEYGTTASYGSSTGHTAYAAVGLIPINLTISGLSPLTTYHYRLVTQNSGGIFTGGDKSFSTSASPEVLAADLDAPTELAFAGAHVYWFEIYSGRLRRAHVSTGEVSTLATVGAFGNSGCIAADANYVYFAANGAIMRADLDGSNLNQNFSQTANTSLIVPHPSGIYVRHSLDILSGGVWTTHYYISKLSLDGSQSTILYEYIPMNSEGFSGDIAVDDTNIYWSDYFKGTIQKMPLAGDSPVTLALGLNHPLDLLLDGATLYVATDDGIKKLPAPGGVVTDVFTSDTGFMTKDGNYIYLAGNGMKKINLETGVSTSLLGNAEVGSPSVVTGSYLYWITGGSHYTSYGKLWRLPKI